MLFSRFAPSKESQAVLKRLQIHFQVKTAAEFIAADGLIIYAMHAGQNQRVVSALLQALNDLLAGTALSSQFMWRIKVGKKKNAHEK
jgi:hypothetical protein